MEDRQLEADAPAGRRGAGVSGAIRFDGRVAIVTGAGNGLGRDYALNLAARGAKVVVNDFGLDIRGNPLPPSDSAADRVVAEIRAAGGEAVAAPWSCATREGGDWIVQAALDAYGKVDIFIHNAGFLRNGAFEVLDDAQIDSIIDVHLKAGFYVGQPAYRSMQKNGYGRILLTSSASAMFGAPWQTNYGAAKAGLAGLINVLALEGAEFGIQANGLLPTGSGRLGRATEDLGFPPSFGQDANPELGLIAPAMANEYVTPMVLWLVSEQCTASHALYSATAGRFARVFIGVTQGWLAGDVPPSPEDVAEQWGAIEDRSTFYEPQVVFDEFDPIVDMRKAQMQG